MFRALLALSAVSLAPGAALAAPVMVHDTRSEFARIAFTQGNNSTSGPGGAPGAVANDRSRIDNLFDTGPGSASSILSLGLGGTLGLEIAPEDRRIVSGLLSERTDGAGRGGHVERADMYLGNNLKGWVLVATLLNRPAGSGSPAVTVHERDLVSFAEPGQDPNVSRYAFTVLGTRGFDSIRFVDKSDSKGRGLDGFDIGTLSVSSVAVPAPGALAVLGAGLLGLGLVARRRAATDAAA